MVRQLLRCSVERKLFPIERPVALARLRLGKNPSTIFAPTGELSAFVATAPSNGHAEKCDLPYDACIFCPTSKAALRT